MTLFSNCPHAGGGQLWRSAAWDLQNKMEEAHQQREIADAGALQKKFFIKYYCETFNYFLRIFLSLCYLQL